MKIVVPTAEDCGVDARVAEHFGRAGFYAVVDTDSNAVRMQPNLSHHFGGTNSPVETILETARRNVR